MFGNAVVKTVIIQKYFDDRLCSGFSERPKQHIDAVNEIGPLLVKLSRLGTLA